MQKPGKSVVLISDDLRLSERIDTLIGHAPDTALQSCHATLAQMNGKAQDFARRSDLIIFHPCTDDPESDLEALRGIRAAGGTAPILAVSEGDVPFDTVRRLMAAGASEVLPASVQDAELGEVVERLSQPRRLTLGQVQSRHGQVTVIAKARGGIGATTLAVNLADQLRAGDGKRKSAKPEVVLLDLDVQFGAVAGFLDTAPNPALFRMARDRIQPDSVFVEQSVETLPSGLAVLSAPEGFMPLDGLDPAQTRTLIETLRQRYDHVVVDLPQAMVEWVTPVLEAATRMYLVAETSVPCVQQTRRLIDFYREQNLALPIEVVVGQHKRPLIRSRLQTEAARALDQSLRHWLPEDRKHAADAMDRGRPLRETATGSGLSRAIVGIAREILTTADPSHHAASQKGN